MSKVGYNICVWGGGRSIKLKSVLQCHMLILNAASKGRRVGGTNIIDVMGFGSVKFLPQDGTKQLPDWDYVRLQMFV